jgi:hypothetical protein
MDAAAAKAALAFSMVRRFSFALAMCSGVLSGLGWS